MCLIYCITGRKHKNQAHEEKVWGVRVSVAPVQPTVFVGTGLWSHVCVGRKRENRLQSQTKTTALTSKGQNHLLGVFPAESLKVELRSNADRDGECETLPWLDYWVSRVWQCGKYVCVVNSYNVWCIAVMQWEVLKQWVVVHGEDYNRMYEKRSQFVCVCQKEDPKRWEIRPKEATELVLVAIWFELPIILHKSYLERVMKAVPLLRHWLTRHFQQWHNQKPEYLSSQCPWSGSRRAKKKTVCVRTCSTLSVRLHRADATPISPLLLA